MDGLSVAASIVGIATAGVQISIKLVTLATQISTASDRVSSIGNDISLTSGVLRQLGELMTQKTTHDGISIFSQGGLETTRTSAAMCERIFCEVEREAKRASEQLRRYKPGQGRMSGEKIELSTIERAKWPFLQPNIDSLRADLRDAKSTLMLMLQVASLALSKRMADASVSTSEDQDFVRAIVALELQRREQHTDSVKQHEVSRSFSSNDTPKIRNANTMSQGEVTLNPGRNPEPRAFLVQASRNLTAGVHESRKTSLDRLAGNLLDPVISSGVDQPRDLEIQNVVNIPLATSPGSKLPETDENSNVLESHAIDTPDKSLSTDDDSETQTNHNTELQLFLLKPIVRDLFDRIELRWSVQSTKMPPVAIREHMAKNEKNDLPSVVEMLQQLHAYEQAMVDSETSKHAGGSILSLRRTKTNIRSRDMLFVAVPGLEFVVQRQVRQPPPEMFQKRSRPQPPPEILQKRSRRRNGLASVFTFLKPFAKKKKGKEIGDDPRIFPLPSLRVLLPSHTADIDQVRRAHETEPLRQYHLATASEWKPSQPPVSSAEGEEEGGMEQAEPELDLRSLGEQDQDQEDEDEDEDAEAVVTGLLAQYTTLFDS
ncbi:MAG: hypothetical protein ASARMPREDX12_003782 [Alectoria sarmentosa]|nr:MAG: hypothetical protein ASARMPREDX12_003782 [Alectoria sarmentosa]